MRILALPYDAPLWIDWREAREKAEADKQVKDVEDALAPFTKPKG